MAPFGIHRSVRGVRGVASWGKEVCIFTFPHRRAPRARRGSFKRCHYRGVRPLVICSLVS